MSSIPTIRVHNPAAPGTMMTINEADRRPEHVLWDDAADARPSTAPALLDPALRDAAAAITLRVIGLKRRMAGLPFAELSAAEQLAVLREMAEDIEQGAAAYEVGKQPEERREPAPPAPGSTNPQAETPPAAENSSLRVGRGPRGLWFVWRGEERVSPGFRSGEEADVERSRMESAAA